MGGPSSNPIVRGILLLVLVVVPVSAGCTRAGPDAGTTTGTGSGQQPAPQGPRPAAQSRLDEAADVVRSYWEARSLAFSNQEEEPLAGREDGAAAVLSREVIDDARLNGKPTPPASTAGDIRVYLPRPGGFPRTFLAAVTATHPDFAPEIYLLVFTRQEPKAPWLASWWVRYADNTPLPPVVVDQDGFATQLGPARQRATLLGDTEAVERRLSDYLERAQSRAGPPRSRFLADTVDTYGTVRQQQAAVSRSRLEGIDTTRFRRDDHLPGYAFRTRDGALLAVTIGQDVVQRYRSRPLIQDPNQLQADRRIPPGTYRTAVRRFVAAYAVHVPEAGSRDRATALASRWAVAEVLAEP
jgi:hypothetical protein